MDGFARGPNIVQSPMLVAAEAWRTFWFHAQDVGLEHIQVRWLSAPGGLGLLGARTAFTLAAAASATHPVDGTLPGALHRCEHLLSVVARTIAEVGVFKQSQRLHDVQCLGERRSREGPKSRRSSKAGVLFGKVRVLQSLKPQGKHKQAQDRGRRSLEGPPEPIGTCWPHPSHRIWHAGISARFCGSCGGFSMGTRTRCLANPCICRAERSCMAARFKRLWAGKHPHTGVALGPVHRR